MPPPRRLNRTELRGGLVDTGEARVLGVDVQHGAQLGVKTDPDPQVVVAESGDRLHDLVKAEGNTVPPS